jgi:hypothetical protein
MVAGQWGAHGQGRTFRILVAAMCAAVAMGAASGGEATRALPKGNSGIAERYPGDVGIAKDTRVVFVEDFEAGSVADLNKSW